MKLLSPNTILLVVILTLSGSCNVCAQTGTEPSHMKQFNITVNGSGQTVKTQMLSAGKTIKTDNNRMYLWYGSQKIMETKGGYDGRLIHGYYRCFYLHSQLKEQGSIRYGLRNKEWKYWYPDGKLKEVIHWKNGVKNGPYELYNDYGQLMARGHFKNDKLHGSFYTYGNAGTLVEKKKYRNGEEVIARPLAAANPAPRHHKEKKEKTAQRAHQEESTETGKRSRHSKQKPLKPKTKVQPQDSTPTKTPFFKRLARKKKAAEPTPVTAQKQKVIHS